MNTSQSKGTRARPVSGQADVAWDRGTPQEVQLEVSTERSGLAGSDRRISRRGLLRAGLSLAAATMGAGVLFEARPSAALAQAAPGGFGSSSALSASPVPTVVTQWNAAALQAIRATRPGPPVVARALAIVHTCVYDAWAAYDPQALGTQLGGALRRPAAEHTLANKSEAVSHAAYHALADLFPSETPLFASLLSSLGYDPSDPSTDACTPRGIGAMAAEAVLAFRHGDGANQLGDLHPGAYSDYTGHVPVNDPEQLDDPNRWQPLRVSDGRGGFVVQQCVTPHWGRVIPFALTTGSQFRPLGGPATYPSDAYSEQAKRILRYSAQLTDRQKMIAEYWADGPGLETPPGHWCLFAQFVSQRDGHDLDADVQLFFALTNAMFDASIACWDVKCAVDYVRPITAVRYLFAGKKVRAWGGPHQGTRLVDGADWQPYQVPTMITPPFPEYVSGHSTFSAAGATILQRFTGSDACGASHTQRAGTSRIEPGTTPVTDVPLSWATFSDAANEAGISRRYGGIHFVDGDLTGRGMGRQIAAQAWQKARGYISGTAGP